MLAVYGLLAPIVLLLRPLRPRALLALGGAIVLLSPLAAWLADLDLHAPGAPALATSLGSYWNGSDPMGDTVGLFVLIDVFSRALGMMLIGVALFKAGRFSPTATDLHSWATVARWGLGVGLPLSAAGLWWLSAADFSGDTALLATIPNTVATPIVCLGYIGVITLWHARASSSRLHRALRATGRMALTNYLTQTVLGVAVLGALAPAPLSRTAIAAFVVLTWITQLAASTAWLRRFRFGPAEWLWRAATYGRWPPLRR